MQRNLWTIFGALAVCVCLQVAAEFKPFDEEQRSQLIPDTCDAWIIGQSDKHFLKTEEGYIPCDEACKVHKMTYRLGSQSVEATKNGVWCCCERERTLMELLTERRIVSYPPGYDSSATFFGTEAEHEIPLEDYNPRKED